jgi:hypothetical protein
MTHDTSSGALAWRPQIEMTKAELDDFLGARLIARVATNGAGGFPMVSPLWYYWDGVAIYLSVAKTRLGGINLLRDPRCAVLIDIDERPVLGMGTNFAKAVHIVGEAEIVHAEPGNTVLVEAGLYKGEQDAQFMVGRITQRYNQQGHEGSVGFTFDDLVAQIEEDAAQGGDAAAQDGGRLVVKIKPRRLRSWDFSKAPFLKS